jgi:transcription initiation factor TFIIIB Brf1 subunit/transcription initiation factor TFIIB
MEGAEWRFYGSQDTKSSDPTRCGMPVNQLLPESSVGTSISYRGKRSHTMNKLRKYQQWNGIPYKERSLLKVFEEIKRLCIVGELPMIIVHEANSLYKIVSSIKISRGANRKGIIAACVYFSCKINKVPRSTSEVAHMFNITIPTMSKGCKNFQEIMQLHKVDINRIHSTNTITIDDFIERFCNKLNLSDIDVNHIKEISRLSQLYNLVNENTPPSMAAGCIYLYTREAELDIHKQLIAETCKISEVTVNKCYKKLEQHKARLFI